MKCADPVTGAFFILLRPPPILARFRALGFDFRALNDDFRALSQPFRAWDSTTGLVSYIGL
ncbi:hypothetical protein SAMN02982927_01850 [Sporolactobacillus nakayamae]|uniref:Uncharacterized protein n=1 Tax=Sporolactobacillus nakayamae TaxID=269670 RepID=A0A1I2S635_9BACL|nr:hypothetical protein SAMN02982927_01850 [Sporolactobacillus nakayamae]